MEARQHPHDESLKDFVGEGEASIRTGEKKRRQTGAYRPHKRKGRGTLPVTSTGNAVDASQP